MQEIGLGQLHFTPDQFWDLTPREFWNALTGYFEHEQYLQRQAWERCRMQTWLLYSIQLDPKDRSTIKEFIPFEWDRDEKKEIKVITPDELDKLVKHYGNKSGS